MKKFKILITGGAGYIGSMLCTKLINFGHQVTVIDILEYDTRSISHLYLKTNISPRQARDKHRENSKKMPFSQVSDEEIDRIFAQLDTDGGGTLSTDDAQV